MEVLIIQPPTPALTAFDQTGGRASHISPPWNALCLLGFLRGRTRHSGRLFDARHRAHWQDELADALVIPRPIEAAVIACDLRDETAVREVVNLLRKTFPQMPLIGFGESPTFSPQKFTAATGADYGLCGDPEPILRQLLDNIHVPFRRQRIASLVHAGSNGTSPLWTADLKTLALPNLADANFSAYETETYPHGLRFDMQVSRGCSENPVDALLRPGNAPLRLTIPIAHFNPSRGSEGES